MSYTLPMLNQGQHHSRPQKRELLILCARIGYNP